MQQIYKKHHGLPAMGILGAHGSTGKQGQSIYIGFINDFFDYTEFDVNTNVKYTKRKESLLMKSNTLWDNYKGIYPNADIETMYYTGEFIKLNASPNGYNQREAYIDVVRYNDKQPGESINPDLDEEPITSYEFNLVTDTTYLSPDGTILDYTEIYDFDTLTDENVSENIANQVPVPSYNVKLDIEHITYDYADLKRIALTKMIDGWEYMFKTALDNDAEPLKSAYIGQEIIEHWMDDPEIYPLFIREKLLGDYSKFIIDTDAYITYKTIKYDVFNTPFTDYVSFPKSDNDYIYLSDTLHIPNNDSILTKLCYIKKPVKIYPRYTQLDMYTNSERYTDVDGYMYVGISDSILYSKVNGDYQLNDFPYIMEQIRRSNSETDIIHMTDLLSVSRNVFENAIEEYKVTLAKNTEELIPSDNTVTWFPGKSKSIKIPTTLSKNIGVGDIIYFYTDESVFASTSKVEYMVVITLDLLSTDIDTLINAAIQVNPFEYSVIESDEINDRAVINNITSIMLVSNDIEVNSGYDNFQVKSLENTLSLEDNNCTLRLISANYKTNTKKLGLFRLYAKSSNFSGVNTSSLNIGNDPIYSMSCYNKDNLVNVFDSSNKRLAISNLAVNKNNVNINFELKDIIYDKNLVFRNGYFIYDNLTEDNLATEYVMTDLSQTPIQNFTYTINKTDFFQNPDTIESDVLSNYYIGYCLTHNGLVIAEEETLNNTLNIDIQPIELLKHNFINWKSNSYYLNSDYQRANDVYKNLTDIILTNSNYNISAADEAIINQLTNTLLTGYDYEVIFTIRKKNGFRYYSNPTTISFIIRSTNPMLIGVTHINEVETVLVNVNYPDIVELNTGTLLTTGNIKWEFNNLTADENNSGDNILEISSEDPNIEIKSILLNSRNITSMNSVKNNWITLTKKESESSNSFIYDVKVNDNIPDIKDAAGNIYSTNNVESYMKLLCDDVDGNSRIFAVLDKNYKPSSTKDRSICLVAVYEKSGQEYFEKFIIKQPGFLDPRTIPGVELKLSSCYDELTDVNKIENGVLCNQFRTYLDIEITDFNVENWGAYGTDNVYMDIELKNIDYDNQNILKYSIENPYRRPTFKFIAMDEYSLSQYQLCDRYGSFYNVPIETALLNYTSMDKSGVLSDYYNDMVMHPLIIFPNLMNHYELEFQTENYRNNFSVNQDVYLTSAISANKHTNTYTDGNKTYVIMDSNFVKACQQPYEAVSGMFHDITLKFSKLPVSDITKNNKIRIAVNFAMGNPIQANMLLQFVVSKIKIYYKGSEFTLATGKSMNTIMSNIYRNTKIYRYSSNVLDVMFNPVSLTACPISEEEKVLQIQGAVKKIGTEEPVKVKTNFYNKLIYKSGLVKIKDYYDFNHIRIWQLWDRWDNMEIKSGYFQDNITSIVVKPINPIDIIEKIDNNSLEYRYFDKDILTAEISLDLSGTCRYLSLVYNANETLNPKSRNGKDTFIYNNIEYNKDRYNQYANESPLFASIKSNLEIRSLGEIDSIDAWNFEFQVADGTYRIESNLVIKGEKNTYGNGYLFLDNSYDTGQYNENDLIGLTELLSMAKKSCIGLSNVSEIKVSEMKNNVYYPDSGKIFRTLLYDVCWEFPWKKDDKIKHYMLIDEFNLLLDSLCEDGKNIEVNLADYLENLDRLKRFTGDIKKTISYNICYDIFPRTGFNFETGTTNVIMLRKPSIGIDSNSIGVTDARKFLNISKTPEKWHKTEDLEGNFIK